MDIENSGEREPKQYSPSPEELASLSEEARLQRERSMFLHPSNGLVFGSEVVDLRDSTPDQLDTDEY